MEIEVLQMSATKGEDLADWYAWLRACLGAAEIEAAS